MAKVRVEVLPWLTDSFAPRRHGRLVWEEEIEDGRSLRDLIQQLAIRNPAFGQVIYDQAADAIRSHVNVILNDGLLELVGGLGAPVKDGDSVIFLPAYTGG